MVKEYLLTNMIVTKSGNIWDTTIMLIILNSNKVNRCLTRYSPRATTTSQPINRAPNEPAMVRNAKFGPNLVVSGQKILFLLEKSKVLLLT